MCLEVMGKGFSCFLEETGRELVGNIISRKAVPKDLNMKFRLIFNHGFTNRGCLHCTILKALYGFKKKRARKARGRKYFLQNVQNEIFRILKIFENNMKFTRAACWISSKISNKDKSITLIMFLFCRYYWSLLWCNCWRSLCYGTPLLEVA